MKLKVTILIKIIIATIVNINYKLISAQNTQKMCNTSYDMFSNVNGRLPKIVGGFDPSYFSFPWLIDLKIKSKRNNVYSHHCGGSIISDKYIITAAHCLINVNKNDIIISAGEYDLEKRDPFETKFLIRDLFIHPDFGKNGFYSNDIALIKLVKSLSRHFKHFFPICLPTFEDTINSQLKCWVTGWGANKENDINPVSMTLKAAEVPLQDQELCRSDKIYGKGYQEILDSMLCAGDLKGGVDACSGDSGGPLTCLRQGVPFLIGIVSWGEGCAKINKPGVYTRVSYYRNWIDQILNN